MKKTNYLLAIVMLFCCFLTVHAADENQGPFYFDWENKKIEDSPEMLALFNDNIAFKNGSVVIRTVEDDDGQTIITRHDAKGKELATTTLEKTLFFSVIADDTNIFVVVLVDEGEEYIQKVIKLDENLNVVKELLFEEAFTPGVDGMINARVFGHDILAIKDDYLYVFCGEEYMLKTKLDLSKWENMEYSKTLFAKYFPDLSAEYDLLYVWMDKLMNGNMVGNYLDMEVTTHVYDGKTISSGMRWFNLAPDEPTSPFAGFIRIKDNSGKVIFEEVNKNYAKIIEARIIGDYVVAVALTEGSVGMSFANSPEQLGNDIIVYDMDGKLVQTIETEGSYVFLNEIPSGFAATHVEYCQIVDKGIIFDGLMGTITSSVDSFSSGKICTYNTETYYLSLEIETKVIGKGKVEAIKDSRKGEVITFKVTPEEGYVLSEIKVTDKNGNVVTFTDYTFTMPNADVTIEAIFNPKNSETSDIAIIATIVIALFGVVVISFNSKKLNWLK